MIDRESQEKLAQKLAHAAAVVEIGATYEHYKKLRYSVITIALQEETGEPCVIYRAEYGKNLVWSRSLTSWLEQVDVDGKKVQRFTKVEES
jgi:hypothetical protein